MSKMSSRPTRRSILNTVVLSAALLSSATLGAAEILYVNVGAIGSNSGNSWSDAYTDLQTALFDAIAGDEIWVAEGKYMPSYETDQSDRRTATFLLADGVGLYGGFNGTELARSQRNSRKFTTTLSGDLPLSEQRGGEEELASYRVVLAQGVGPGTVLDGFHISGGIANGFEDKGMGAGVGVFASQLELRDVFLERNQARHHGAGIYALDSGVTVDQAFFTNNSAGRGAGLHLAGSSNATLTRSFFRDNESTTDGGAAITLRDASSLDVVDTTMHENRGERDGGAIEMRDLSRANMTDTRLIGNGARMGGGIFLGESAVASMTNSLIVGNDATGVGGGIHAAGSAAIILTNSDVVDNHSSAAGGGVVVNDNAAVIVQNSVIYSNRETAPSRGGDEGEGSVSPQIWQQNPASVIVDVNYSNIEGGHDGVSNLFVSPAFIRAPRSGDGDWRTTSDNNYGNLRIRIDSQLIDAGDNSADLDGPGPGEDTIESIDMDYADNSRLWDVGEVVDTGNGVGQVVDMGAYEHIDFGASNDILFIDDFEEGTLDNWAAPDPIEGN